MSKRPREQIEHDKVQHDEVQHDNGRRHRLRKTGSNSHEERPHCNKGKHLEATGTVTEDTDSRKGRHDQRWRLTETAIGLAQHASERLLKPREFRNRIVSLRAVRILHQSIAKPPAEKNGNGSKKQRHFSCSGETLTCPCSKEVYYRSKRPDKRRSLHQRLVHFNAAVECIGV